MAYRLIEKIKQLYYRGYLRWKMGSKLNNVTVMGKVWVQNCTIDFGENVVLYPNVSFTGSGHISLGNNVKVGEGTIFCSNKNGGIQIGDHTLIAANCYLIDSEHEINPEELISKQPLRSAPIYIGRDVWLGADVTVLSGSRIRDGAVIGAKSLVNSDIPEYSVAYGIPARIKRKR